MKANDKNLLLNKYTYALVNVNISKLPENIIKEVNFLEHLYIEQELTLNGLIKRKSRILEKYIQKNDKHNLVYNQENEWPPKQNIKNSGIPDIKNNSTLRKLLWDMPNIHNDNYKNIRYRKENSKWIEDNIGTLENYEGSLPWEKNGFYKKLTENIFDSEKDHEVPKFGQRQLLDMFAESLLHVNRLYNSEFGYQARRVPAHMPHLINKDVMRDLQERFTEEFELTSSHSVRQANDMQYAFSYFFFLMSSKIERTLDEVFDEFDTDNSGTWSDREIRTFLSRHHDLPLHYSYVQNFHQIVENCSSVHHVKSVPTPAYERYADSNLPTVSLELVLVCDSLSSLLKKQQKIAKYRHTQHNDELVHFKMISSNVSTVVHHLDEVRKNPRKFICLNSNLDPASKDNELIHALVQDTYESLFPIPSSMELPPMYRNRFLHIHELRDWKHWRDIIRALIYASLASLIMLTLVNFFSNEIESIRRRWCRRKRRREGYGTSRV
ncbi:unnamed protein product [Meganyctiphanes norvegica]|uniref:EF-hand domain-containing protein n=1 Tax=Meganyctiphanes norvegica TaxID=48144 RepID=A0AAV2RPX1_MEGNR